MKPLIYILFITLLLFSCSKQEKNEKFTVVTTTGMIADAVRNITGDKAEVMALMGPGVDPHLYKATLGDLSKLNHADLIIYNGLHLEGKMSKVFEKLARQKNVYALSNGLPAARFRHIEGFNDAHDPHIWFSVKLWRDLVEKLSLQLQKNDPANAEYYKTNTVRYLAELDQLDQYVREQISAIPEKQRVLITAHDAFGYFGDAYHIEIVGLQGISTSTEFGLNDRVRLINMITDRNIKAVFVETSVSERDIESVVQSCKEKGHNVHIGGSLYSDAMGDAGTPEGTYIGMVRANVATIVNALR